MIQEIMTLKSEVERMYSTTDFPIDWSVDNKGAEFGYVKCPNIDMHTSPNKFRDCVIYIDGFPNFHCQHESCREANRMHSSNLAWELGNLGLIDTEPKKMTSAQTERFKEKCAHLKKAEAIARQTDWIRERYAWPVAQIKAVSRPIKNQWQEFLSLWPEDDVMWCGETHHSADFGKGHFKEVSEWKKYDVAPWPFVCGTAFQKGTVDRSKDTKTHRRFFVIECDGLDPDPAINMDMSGSVIRYLREAHGFTLRAIISSGGKSLHAWFDYDEEKENWVNEVLPVGLGVDRKALNIAQPVRAAGVTRPDTGKQQELLWLE